ncbi:MAG: septation protein SpoVG family protein [Elusimicrobiota bacterium]
MRKMFGGLGLAVVGSVLVFLYSSLYTADEETDKGGGSAKTGEIYVTSVEKIPVDEGAVKEMATIVLNDCIKVKEIQVIKLEGKTTLKYPVYVSKRGKEYPQFETLTKQASDEIEKAIKSGKPSKKTSKSISFKITNFSPLRSQSSRKVNASVDFNNAVRVSCGVMEGKRGPWISWPSRKDEETGKWKKQVLIINKKVKDVVEKSLLDKYRTAGSEESSEDE